MQNKNNAINNINAKIDALILAGKENSEAYSKLTRLHRNLISNFIVPQFTTKKLI